MFSESEEGSLCLWGCSLVKRVGRLNGQVELKRKKNKEKKQTEIG